MVVAAIHIGRRQGQSSAAHLPGSATPPGRGGAQSNSPWQRRSGSGQQ